MISKKFAQPLFMILMSFGMSVIMSGVVTAVNTGMVDGFSETKKEFSAQNSP